MRRRSKPWRAKRAASAATPKVRAPDTRLNWARWRAPTRSSARTMRISTAAPAGGAVPRTSQRPRNSPICWPATSTFRRAARRTRRPGAAAARSPAADLLWHDAVAPDIDAGGFERAVGFLGRGDDIDIGPGLELVLAADHIGADHGIGPDDDLLLAVLVLDHDHLTVDPGDRGVHCRIGHRAVRPIPRPVTLAGAALRLGEDHDLDRALAAVRLGRCADADEGARFPIGQARLDHPVYRRVVGELHLHVAGLAGLDCQRRTVHRLYRPANPHGLLRDCRQDRKHAEHGGSRERVLSHPAHILSSSPKLPP